MTEEDKGKWKDKVHLLNYLANNFMNAGAYLIDAYRDFPKEGKEYVTKIEGKDVFEDMSKDAIYISASLHAVIRRIHLMTMTYNENT